MQSVETEAKVRVRQTTKFYNKTPTPHDPNAVLAKRAGSSASHAVLLCSLLLGFGQSVAVYCNFVVKKLTRVPRS